MVGYCSKDIGRSHFRTASKNVSRTEINVALAEYRKLQRQVVKDVRLELGKKNFWICLHRFRQEFLRPLTPSPVTTVTWMIQDGEYLPSYSWICPTSALPMDALRAEAYYVALVCPSLFRREHAYSLFFSGGPGGRVSESFELWDNQDAEWIELTCDQAKVHAGRRAEVEDSIDSVAELRNRRRASAAVAHRRMPGVPQYLVGPDSDSDEEPPPPLRPSALVPTFRRGLGSHADGSDLLPALAHPSCAESGCDKGGTVTMVPCNGTCGGLLHPNCGLPSPDSSRRTCSSCAPPADDGEPSDDADPAADEDTAPLPSLESCCDPGCTADDIVNAVPCHNNCGGILHLTCGVSTSLDDSQRTCSLCAGLTRGKRRRTG